MIQILIDKKVTFRILNMGTFDNTPQGKMSLTMFLAFAEFERDMIIARTQSGISVRTLLRVQAQRRAKENR